MWIQIVYVKIPPGRGCGFVQYVQRSSAETAIAKMQGEDIKGCKVGRRIREPTLSDGHYTLRPRVVTRCRDAGADGHFTS